MGINGLLPYLAEATKTCHISEFRGGTVAVDSYCLLHKGANACAEQLARGEDNQMYVQYCIKYVKLFLTYDIHPIMVFDGRNLPAKAETEAKRRESRKKAKQRAAELLKLGKTDEARTYLKQCIDITPKMAHNLITECRKLNVDCIVAPYESDAQLAFFNMKGVADCVITEDSDLVLFGCHKVLYKLDLGGTGRLVDAEKIPIAMKIRPDQFTFDKFRFMCILSGCDYVNSLSGIGLKKAEKFLKLTAEKNPEVFLDRIPRYLNMRHLEVTEEYKRNVLIANATFLHQIVFNPYQKKLTHLKDPEVCGTNPAYLINCGDKFDNEKAYQVALGNLNPYNFEKYDDWTPADVAEYSIWSGVYKKRISKAEEKEIQKNRLQEYFKKEKLKLELYRTEEEHLAIEEDKRIDEELSVYTKNVQVREKLETSNEEEKHEDSFHEKTKNKNNTSPVLAKNPFLKKKQLSKFPKTFTYGNTIVKSRFFSSDLLMMSESTNNTNTQSENNFSEIVEKTNSVDMSEYSENVSLLPENEVLKSCENNSDVFLKNMPLKETFAKELHDKNADIKTEAIIDLTGENKSNIIKAPFEKSEEQEVKRRKLGPCRTVGLSKKPARQHTLHSLFGKLKKPD